MMVRVRLSDPECRDAIAASLRFANLIVTYPEADDTLYVDFAAFDLSEVQVRIVTLMLDAWQQEHRGAGLGPAEIAAH
jgi:hypothetical protein